MRKLTLKDRFDSQKASAKIRGIPFLLSYEQWLKIWTDSGHLHERGIRKGQYVMSRFGDKGAYEAGNVRIITQQQNSSEIKQTEEVLSKMRVVFLGRTHTDETKAKISKNNLGKHSYKHTDETKKIISLANLGNQNWKFSRTSFKSWHSPLVIELSALAACYR